MSVNEAIIVDAADRLLGDFSTHAVRNAAADGEWPETLWQRLQDAGLTTAAVTENRGGEGMSARDCFALARIAGRHAIPVPLVESMLAEQVLAAAGLPPQRGILGIAPGGRKTTLVVRGKVGSSVLSGEAKGVPWGRHLSALVVVVNRDDQDVTVLVPGPFRIMKSENVAGEPRDTIIFADQALPESCVGHGMSQQEFRSLGAIYRCAQMMGAMHVAMEMTIKYSLERQQFGRPLAKFQAVQQQIAIMASEIIASDCIVSAAIEAIETGMALFEIAAAKSRLGKAVDVVIDVAHQVHGAFGTTREYALHDFTMRLSAWRDEFGSPNEWNSWIGRLVCRGGGGALWPFLTAASRIGL